ncbi:hypothetical protein BX666DRAFT_2031027 [Dichotomocladium elegans]|nr:hypothetical protein BX666DRAFT_2031027 [Dichotomocladium elegans]
MNPQDQLRSRYLNFCHQIAQTHPRAQFTLPDKSRVQGNFVAIDSQANRIRVDHLQTPTGTLPHAVLRGTDVDVIEFMVLIKPRYTSLPPPE